MPANMKTQDGRSIEGPSLRGLWGRSAAGLNGRAAAKTEVSAVWWGGWMPANISGAPPGKSVFHLTSPLIGQRCRQCGGEAGCRKIFLALRQGKVFFT